MPNDPQHRTATDGQPSAAHLHAAHLLVLRAAERAIKPKGSIRVSEWAAEHRILAEEGSAEAGKWSNARAPYLVEIMDALSEDAPGELVVFQKPTQSGGTEAGSNWLGSIIDHAKGPVAVVMPTERSLSDWMSQKFDPMARATPSVAAALATRSNKASDNNAQRKKFTGGILYTKTAGSTADLKATSLRYALADELDEWKWETTHGDPFGLLQARLSAFHDGKIFAVSSPMLKDASRIEELFEAGDRRRYHVACPHCDERQYLKWTNLRWQNPAVTDYGAVKRAWYACEHCGAEIQEHHKTAMLAGGKWIPDQPGAPYRSYHLNAIYSPIGLGRSWAQLATEWIAAQSDKAKLMRFVNTRLAETWADRSRDIKANAIQSRAGLWRLGSIPPGCLVLTAGVDTQDDRLEIQVLGHGKGDRTWTVDYHILHGSPADESTWGALADYLARDYTNAHGKALRIEATFIDSGGHHTHDVYGFARSRRARRCEAAKSHSSPARQIVGRPTRQDVNARGKIIKNGVALYMLGADTAKHLLYQRLADDAEKSPEDRKVNFPEDLDPNYYDQLTAEAFNPRRNRWELKKGKRNEALDTWVLALAASHHPDLYLHKWRASDWDRRAALLEPSVPRHAEPTAAPSPIAAIATPDARDAFKAIKDARDKRRRSANVW